MKRWIKAFRLRTLPLSFSTILLGSAFAYSKQAHHSDEFGNFSLSVFLLCLLTTLLLQILSNLANDYGDAQKGADNEHRIGPARAIQSGEISAREMLRAIIVVSLLALISGSVLLYLAFGSDFSWVFFSFFLLGLASIAAAIKYTVGKGAYGYRAMGDLFVFIFFGLVGVAGPYFLQLKMFEWIILFPAITMGCFSVAVLNLNNMRDRKNDAAVGKKTLAVVLGFERSKKYHFFLFLLAYMAFPLPLLLLSPTWWPLIAIVPVTAIHMAHLKTVYNVSDEAQYDPELKKVALSSFVFSVLIWVSVLLDRFF